MGYVEQNLMEDEKIELACKLHPIVLLAPAMTTSFLAGSLSMLQDIPLAFGIVVVLLAFSAYRLLCRLVLYLTSEYAITSKRVLGKTGFIRRKSLDIVLSKVEAIRLTQSISGRILDYGDIEVTGTGGTDEMLCFIPAPLEFRMAIQQQLSILSNETGHDQHPEHQ